MTGRTPRIAGRMFPEWPAECHQNLHRGKSRWLFIAFIAGIGITAAILKFVGMSSESTTRLTLRLNLRGVANILGRLFANNIGINCDPMLQSEIVGYLCIVLVIALLALHCKRRTSPADLAVALAIVGFGGLGAAAISLSRDNIAPWYTLHAVYVWSGLIALSSVASFRGPIDRFPSLSSITIILPFVVAVGLYPFTNLSYRNQDYYEKVHSPASESAIRHCWTAPTYSAHALHTAIESFNLNQRLCEPQWRRGWTACSSHQRWSLQGDYILPEVTVKECPGSPSIRWIRGSDYRKKVSWSDAEHRNLALDTRSSLTWKFQLPPSIRQARLITAIASATGVSENAGQSARFRISDEDGRVLTDSKNECSESFEPVSIDLSEYANRALILTLNGEETAPAGMIVFEAPRIEIAIEKNGFSGRNSKSLEWRPGNTDYSPSFPRLTERDLAFALPDEKLWKVDAMDRREDSDSTVADFDLKGVGSITLLPGISVSPRQYSHVYFEMSASSDIGPRLACIQLIINGTSMRQVIVPLVSDDGMHGYVYDLKLLELEPSDKISYFKMLPVYMQTRGSIKLKQIRFLARS